MLETIEKEDKQIKELQEHKKRALIIYGYLSAEDDYYQSKRNKIIVLDNGSNRTFENNQEDDLKYIRKRKDGRYEFRRTIGGRPFQFINRDLKEVRKYAASINRKVKLLLAGQEEEDNITFYDYAEKFYHLFKEKGASDKTKEEYATALKYFKEHFNKPFKNIGADTFQKFINKLFDEKPTTALKIYNKICAICRKAFLTGIIKRNIAEILDKPKVEYNVRRALTFAEQETFLKEIKKQPQDFQLFCIFCLITSARREEAIRYKPQDFNKKHMTLFINGTKTLNAPRTIQITKAFANLLEKIGTGFQHTGDYYSKKAKDIFKNMGSSDLTFNCLRHTCATNMVYLQISSDFRKHIMGHSTIVVTDRVYTHMEVGIKKKDILRLYGNLYFTDF